ncbi:hypothetical protein FRC11_008984, partial [Ceratobasidium sp. 423]
MQTKLPIELLDLVVQYATTDTQIRLSAVSRDVYSISVRELYASIPGMSISRTTKCLLTLSTKPELARLVRSFYFNLSPSPHVLRAFQTRLLHALGIINNLHILALDLDAPMDTSLLGQISCRLTELYCTLPPEGSSPLSQFLSTQPAIEKLLIICRPDDICSLGRDGLPVLRELAAPSELLPRLLPSRLSRLSRLTVLRTMAGSELFLLNAILATSAPPQSMELIIQVKITRNMTGAAVSAGLGLLGRDAPLISLLVLKKYGDYINK